MLYYHPRIFVHMKRYDITLLTCRELLQPDISQEYNQNVLLEDRLLTEALQNKGLTVYRTSWDDPEFHWGNTKTALFRTTWDYFHRYKEFKEWLLLAGKKTRFINPLETIIWNMDKHYLQDLTKQDIPVVPTLFIEAGYKRSLNELATSTGWEQLILKPAISGAARHTYRIGQNKIAEHEQIFSELIAKEAMMLQPFLKNIITRGEVSHMVFNGKYSHSVLKKAKLGDFRVQDDHGGTLHDYVARPEEKALAESAVKAIKPIPVYARVDVSWNDKNEPVLIELELIEPELWLRKKPNSANVFAEAICSTM